MPYVTARNSIFPRGDDNRSGPGISRNIPRRDS